MGKIDFSELRPQAPIEALVGASAIVRGIYLFIADAIGRNTVVTTDSGIFNIIVGTIFTVSGALLAYGSLRDHTSFRLVGLTLVGLQTAIILFKSAMDQIAEFPILTGNLVMLGVCGWLIYLVVRGDKE